jgi:hypothetical protein
MWENNCVKEKLGEVNPLLQYPKKDIHKKLRHNYLYQYILKLSGAPFLKSEHFK